MHTNTYAQLTLGWGSNYSEATLPDSSLFLFGLLCRPQLLHSPLTLTLSFSPCLAHARYLFLQIFFCAAVAVAVLLFNCPVVASLMSLILFVSSCAALNIFLIHIPYKNLCVCVSVCKIALKVSLTLFGLLSTICSTSMPSDMLLAG